MSAELDGYSTFTDWPALTVKLVESGFDEDGLRKILRLNYIRFFRTSSVDTMQVVRLRRN